MDVWEYETRRYASKKLWVLLAAVLYMSHWLIVPLMGPLFLKLIDSYGEIFTHVFLVLLVHHVAYIFFGMTYIIIALLDIPFFNKYKINEKDWPWKTDPELIRRAVKTLAMNFFVYIPTFLILSRKLSVLSPRYDKELPGLFETMMWMPIFQAIDSVYFFVTHWALHFPWLYKKIHKQHHEFNTSIGIAAEYAHPAEFFVVNVLGTAVGPVLAGEKIHFMVILVWVFFRITFTLENHSGYDFPWGPSGLLPFSNTATFHDFHHSDNCGNFGGHFMFIDLWFGYADKFFIKQRKLALKEKKLALKKKE